MNFRDLRNTGFTLYKNSFLVFDLILAIFKNCPRGSTVSSRLNQKAFITPSQAYKLVNLILQLLFGIEIPSTIAKHQYL